ncbi:MAG: hypothetical protein ACXWQO_03620 [Bdellovibrionota bacterium]
MVPSSMESVAPAHLAWSFRLLQVSLALLMAGAGADKIFQVSLSWNEYLPPVLPWILGTNPGTFLSGLGFFELILALGIVFSPAYFGAVTSLWLLMVNLVLIADGSFHYLALCDLALAISAFALGTLGQLPSLSPHASLRPKRFRLLSLSYQRFHAAP